MHRSKAHSFLARTEQAFRGFCAAKDQLSVETNASALSAYWSQLLSEFRKFLRFSELAARNFGRNDWADALTREVNATDVFTYLFHARNADEHAVVAPFDPHEASLNVGRFISFSGVNTNITISNCVVVERLPGGQTVERRIDGKFSTNGGQISEGWLKSEVPVSRVPAHLRLGAALDRGKRYELPNLGCRAEDTVSMLAQRAYNWMYSKIKALRGFSVQPS